MTRTIYVKPNTDTHELILKHKKWQVKMSNKLSELQEGDFSGLLNHMARCKRDKDRFFDALRDALAIDNDCEIQVDMDGECDDRIAVHIREEDDCDICPICDEMEVVHKAMAKICNLLQKI